MEIERKFLIKDLPELSEYTYKEIEQGYLCYEPVIRIRKEDDNYYMTYKGKGLMVREEYNLPLNKESYYSMLSKMEGRLISKKRYIIPYFAIDKKNLDRKYVIELDVFSEDILVYGKNLIMAEVEFDSEEDAMNFNPPLWFGKEVTEDRSYANANISRMD